MSDALDPRRAIFVVSGTQGAGKTTVASLLARSFYDAGFTAIIDDIIVGDRVPHLIEELGDLEFFFVLLAPSIEAVRDRERLRGTELWREWEWLTESIPNTTSPIGLWLDSSHQTAEETVDEIMRRAWQEAPVSAQTVGTPI